MRLITVCIVCTYRCVKACVYKSSIILTIIREGAFYSATVSLLKAHTSAFTHKEYVKTKWHLNTQYLLLHPKLITCLYGRVFDVRIAELRCVLV